MNYELNLGARKFKCTTIPIIRKEYGVVGAICINVDANYLTEEVLSSSEKVINFFQSFCRTDMQLDNILSRDEYAKALKGKRTFTDSRFDERVWKAGPGLICSPPRRSTTLTFASLILHLLAPLLSQRSHRRHNFIVVFDELALGSAVRAIALFPFGRSIPAIRRRALRKRPVKMPFSNRSSYRMTIFAE